MTYINSVKKILPKSIKRQLSKALNSDTILKLRAPVTRNILARHREKNISEFESIWQEKSRFPKRFNLMSSLKCSAKCVYCPSRGTDIAEKLMPIELVDKIVTEAKSVNFNGIFSTSDNGDALMHPKFQQIIEKISNGLPDSKIIYYSNMILMNKKNASWLLPHLSSINFNLDGNDPENYEFVKGFKNHALVKKNIEQFFELREKINKDCKVDVNFATAKWWSETVEGDGSKFRDDTNEIKEWIQQFLKRSDTLTPANIVLQKYQYELYEPKVGVCDLWSRVLDHMNVSPDGKTPICCIDFGVTSTFGNLNDKSIKSIWSGKLRKNILKNLYLMKYEGTPLVCQTCLPSYSTPENRDEYHRIRKILKTKISKDIHLKRPNAQGLYDPIK